MKRAFTLIELMISIILLSIIVTFLYQAVAQLQNSNQKLLTRADEVDKREDVLKLLYNDFINARSLIWREKLAQRDTIVLQTSHSLYDMSQPYVLYKLYADEKSLRRIESPIQSLGFEEKRFRFDTVLRGVDSFKVYESRGHYFIYLKSEGMEEIYLDIVPPSMGFKSEPKADTNSSADQNTSEDVMDGETVEAVQDES
jgi:prepilin-type N-terminal cleavage/methylation domain-containing protein